MKPIKRKQPKRFWDDARAKVNAEGVCRVCGPKEIGSQWLEAAHTIEKKVQDQPMGFGDVRNPNDDERLLGWTARMLYVNPNSIVPLCKTCHMAYDARRLDLLPYMTREEEEDAVRAVGIARAYQRLTSNKEAI